MQRDFFTGVGDLDDNEKEIVKTRFLLHFATRTKLPIRVTLKEILLHHGIEVSDEEINVLLAYFFVCLYKKFILCLFGEKIAFILSK